MQFPLGTRVQIHFSRLPFTSRKRYPLQLTEELLCVRNYSYMTLAAEMTAPDDVDGS
jgi:hypothetical protein